jgi:sialate O-acetylesterase
MKLSRILCLAWFVVALVAIPAAADTALPAIFSDNMVLQRGQALPIWGTDDKAAEVTVTLGDAKATAKVEGGKWMAKLPAQKAAEATELTVEGSSKITLKNVAIGEVWLCSGQSNMEWSVAASKNPQEEIAAAKHPRIRHIKLEHTLGATPQDSVPSKLSWQVCTPQTVPQWTAVGYYFARHLQKELDVPIGLIGSNWGGTRIEPWTPPEGFQQVPALKDITSKLDQVAKGKPSASTPTAMYNAMIHPLVPYAIQGALWYQGESNNGEGMQYAEKMKALIGGWRKVWNRDHMPFYFVQLAPYRYSNAKADRSLQLPGIWEAQAATLAVPHTAMAVTTDTLGEKEITDIHPKNKQEVGKRLALCALAKTYGKSDLVYSGPLYKSMKVEGSKVRIAFDHTGSGLVSRDGKPLTWFTIAGEDKKFVEAKAEIDGNSVVVSAESISRPVAVRFAYHEEAQPNLANKEGLPAAPFRTDK